MFIVVLSTLVIHSVVAKGPIIFMTLGQQSVGAFDGIYAPASSQEPLEKVNTYSQTAHFIDFNKAETLLKDNQHLTPRFHICDVNLGFADDHRVGCLMALDFEREKRIDLAPRFPFESLETGECILSEEYKRIYNLKEGQQVELGFTEPDLWTTLARYYNKEAAEQGWKKVPDTVDSGHVSNFKCEIAGFYDSSHGKFSEDPQSNPKD